MIDPFNKPDIVGPNTISRLDNQKKTFYRNSNYNHNNHRNTLQMGSPSVGDWNYNANIKLLKVNSDSNYLH